MRLNCYNPMTRHAFLSIELEKSNKLEQGTNNALLYSTLVIIAKGWFD